MRRLDVILGCVVCSVQFSTGKELTASSLLLVWTLAASSPLARDEMSSSLLILAA